METKPEDEPMPLNDVNLDDENIFIQNDSPDWVEEPSPDRHLCIRDKHQNGCEHFRPPIYPDDIITHETIDNSSAFMSLQDLEDMNVVPHFGICPFLKRCCTILEFQNGMPILKWCCTILEHLSLAPFQNGAAPFWNIYISS